MPFAWRPAPGQVALIEVVGLDDCLTGIVLEDDGVEEAPVVIDLGASPRPPGEACEVVASFFAPDALYRVSAVAVPHDGGAAAVIDLRVRDIERVQRRQAPRARQNFRAVLSNFDDPGALISVVGETIDVSEGGCRVRTSKMFPNGCDPTVTIALPGGEDVVTLGAVLQSIADSEGYEYRIVFLEIDDDDRSRLARLVTELAAA